MRQPKPISCIVILIALFHFSDSVGAQDVGDKLPPLNVTDWITGDADRDTAWGDGNVYVFEIWGTWCAPCIKLMPELTKLQNNYKDKGLVVIGYSWEDPAKLRKFVEQHKDKIGYTIVSDTTQLTVGKLNENGAIQGFPYSFLVGENGKILWKGNSKSVSRAVELYFAKKPIVIDDGPDF